MLQQNFGLFSACSPLPASRRQNLHDKIFFYFGYSQELINFPEAKLSPLLHNLNHEAMKGFSLWRDALILSSMV